MAEKKSLVEDAILQMKNLEEAIAENAKGILASTMGQEIKELVKESLNESDEDEEETEEEVDMDVDMADMSMDNEDSDEEMDSEDEMDSEEEEMGSDEEMDSDTIDLTKSSDEDVLKVFQLMEPTDSFVVTKDESGNIHLKDEDKEYMIVQEGEEMETEMDEEMETEMDEEMETEMETEMDEEMDSDSSIEEIVANVFGDGSEDEMDSSEMDETIYEIEMDEEDEMDEEWNEEMSSEMMEDSEEDSEENEMDENIYESKKMSVKPKGVGIGSPKFKYSSKPNTDGGFKVVKKNANKTMGTGKAKFEYKEGENLDGKMKPVKGVKKMETKEASRTLGTGKYFGKKGLPKPKAAPRHLRVESVSNEVEILREKNEEYKKALNVFRDKLNEVAVFNSNLAYATRLFTEHSTSKQEKINILRRFDGVESLKESKNLYKQIKDELSNQTSQPMNESIERIVENTQTSGSAANLIESKTYENPQFLRMKDLMSKLK